ncbi:MAG: hypothetical protein ABSB61_11140 [Anaerolineales bacterium]|jgi:hypothetical protein
MPRKNYPYLATAVLISWLGSCSTPATPLPTQETLPTQTAQPTGTPVSLKSLIPQIVVNDQSAMDGTVTVASAVAIEQGWLAINTDKDGSPSDIVIGYSPVKPGVNTNVVVIIDLMHATSRLWVVLHVDEGQVGTWEFPGPDVPVQVGGKTIMSSFNVTLPAAVAPAA